MTTARGKDSHAKKTTESNHRSLLLNLLDCLPLSDNILVNRTFLTSNYLNIHFLKYLMEITVITEAILSVREVMKMTVESLSRYTSQFIFSIYSFL